MLDFIYSYTSSRRLLRALPLLFVSLLGATTVMAQSGHVLNGVGPVDQSWAGAGMASPQEGLMALHWNPASITDFDQSTLDVSLQLLIPSGNLGSSVNQGAFGPFGPTARLAGSTRSTAGPFPIPAVGFIYVPQSSRWRFGLSAFGVGGFGVDDALNPENPINTPQPPGGLGFGHISSAFALVQASPTLAYKVSNHVSIGFAPTLNYATLKVGPFPAAPPDDANGDGFPTYASAPTDGTFGYGLQAGVHVADLDGFSVGASFKSTQYFDAFAFNSEDETGGARTLSFELDYPMILSAGIGYAGLNRFEFVADARYIDFAHTSGFDVTGFDQQGAVKGFGWNSIMVVAMGIQYELTPQVPVRLGYSFNENPIGRDVVFFNTPSPAIIQHHLAGGFSYNVSRKVTASVAAQYGFKNNVEGQWQSPQWGAIHGTSVECDLSTFTLIFGVHVNM